MWDREPDRGQPRDDGVAGRPPGRSSEGHQHACAREPPEERGLKRVERHRRRQEPHHHETDQQDPPRPPPATGSPPSSGRTTSSTSTNSPAASRPATPTVTSIRHRCRYTVHSSPPPSMTAARIRVPSATTSTIHCGTASRPRSRSEPKAMSVSPNNHSTTTSVSEPAAATTKRSTSAGDRSMGTATVLPTRRPVDGTAYTATRRTLNNTFFKQAAGPASR